MNKKGVNEIIASVLIILIVLVSVVLVWNVIRKTLSETSERVGAEQLSVSLSTQMLQLSSEQANISVIRNPGAGNISEIKIIISNGTTSITYTNNTRTPNELETLTYSVSLSGLANASSFEVYPVIKTSGGKIVGVKAEIKKGKPIAPPVITPSILCYGNYDGDGYYNGSSKSFPNSCPVGYNISSQVIMQVDCNDTNSSINYDADEICSDSIDNNCNGRADCSDSSCSADSYCSLVNSALSYWKLEGNANDERGANNGSLMGGVNCNFAGRNNKGKSCFFDGVNDYIIFSNSINQGSMMTLSYWINSAKNSETYVGNMRYSGASGYAVNPTSVRVWLGNGSTNRGYSFSNAPALNTWQHYAVVINLFENITLYKNGARVSTIPSNLKGNIGSGAFNFSLGKDAQFLTYYLNGSMDEVMIFNRGLSLQEIQTIYNN